MNDQAGESFASLYLAKKRGARGASRGLAQSGLFDVPPVVEPVNKPALIRGEPLLPQTDEDEEVLDAVGVASMLRRVWTVRELVGEVRGQVERAHWSVWVEGEVSNCRAAGSGHFYFTLKDGEAQLPVVMFRRQAQLAAALPKDGDAVEARGRVSVYEPRGQLQLIAETVELRGAGALELAFKRLKARLSAEGLFAAERKRPLPAFPRCLGIVTSPQGAVVRDIVNVVRRRHACLNLLVYPAAMQGARCAPGVIDGIRWFNDNPGKVDLIMLARGGGSIEDLAGFNDEGLARAIAASELPVVSAIGHETDFTIADFVADLRAPTPSVAAELVTAAQHRIEERVYELAKRVERGGMYQIMLARQRYTRIASENALLRLRDAIGRREQRIDELNLRLESAARRRLVAVRSSLSLLTERRRLQDPAARMESARRKMELLAMRLERLGSRVGAREAQRLRALQSRLKVVPITAARRARLERTVARLQALSPLAVLGRGYALVYAEDGRLLRNAAEIRVGERVQARLGAGTLIGRVEEIR